jgi:uncharacterized membrane protein YphA (DoxX/SURF4 family)
LLTITLTILIALVWLINGLFCKLLSFVPRHQLIVARILGSTHAKTFTIIIGVLETGMCCWILSGFWPVTCAWFQILVVAVMNIIEFLLARDLLLFGKINAVIAGFFIFLVYFNTFLLPNLTNQLS